MNQCFCNAKGNLFTAYCSVIPTLRKFAYFSSQLLYSDVFFFCRWPIRFENAYDKIITKVDS